MAIPDSQHATRHVDTWRILAYTSLKENKEINMDKSEEIKLLLAEEQTLLSRERTMHSYMQTGLAFTSVGLVIIKFLEGLLYFCPGVFFIILGSLLIIESGKRYMRFRRAIRRLREKESSLGYDIGISE
jgi:uncharacterized membrane protein YidH (DUF202 family)